MQPQAFDLLAGIQSPLDSEVFETLLEGGAFRIERILSNGQTSPAEGWYDADHAEWVVVLEGEARLLFEENPEPFHLKRHQGVLIPANCRHRVLWTPSDQITVWLAVHFDTASVHV